MYRLHSDVGVHVIRYLVWLQIEDAIETHFLFMSQRARIFVKLVPDHLISLKILLSIFHLALPSIHWMYLDAFVMVIDCSMANDNGNVINKHVNDTTEIITRAATGKTTGPRQPPESARRKVSLPRGQANRSPMLYSECSILSEEILGKEL